MSNKHAGPPLPARLSRRHEGWLYASAGLLFLSGLAWVIQHYWMAGAGEFGDAAGSLQAWLLRIHGAAAMAFLIALGSLLPGHIVRGWRARRNHRSGMTLLALAAVLIVSAYALYYLSNEDARPWVSALHWVLGMVGAVYLPLHVLLGRWSKGERLRVPHLIP